MPSAIDLATLGPRLEHDKLFPERANIGVAEVRDERTLRLRVWERGAGITRACGSGACAAVVAAHRRGLTGRRVTVLLDGGALDIEWRDHDRVLMTGPAALELRGRVRPGADRRLMMAAPEIITFGCRLNAFESEIIRRAAGEAGLADAVIVNTCAVTAEAERQARQAIRRARREHPGARIIVTGCAATLAPARYAALPEVDLVLDNDAKLRAESYAAIAPTPTLPRLRGRGSAIADASGALPPPQCAGEGWGGGLGAARTRAYLQVQQGCDHRCTFCIIPYARGPSRSVPMR